MRLLFAIVFCCLAFFVHSQNSLYLHSRSGELFQVMVGDSLLNKSAQTSVHTGNFSNDTLRIRLVLKGGTLPEQEIYLLERGRKVQGREIFYLIDFSVKPPKFIYQSNQKLMPLRDPLVPPQPVIDTNSKYRNNVLGHYCEMKNGKPHYFNNNPKDGICKTNMPAEYINYMKILMNKAEIEDERYQIAENTAMNNCVSVAQLNILLSHIAYEVEKLRLIKTVYPHLTNKQDAHHLDSTFKLESSKLQLHGFLKEAAKSKIQTIKICTVPSKDAEIRTFFERIATGSSDQEKLEIFRKSCSEFCYSLEQAKMITGLFAHDDKRLETAKQLYSLCTEKEKFMNLSTIFAYKNTESELREYIRMQN